MTPAEISRFINVATANQLLPEQVCQVMDAAQKAAFEADLDAFLVFNRRLTVLVELRMKASGYEIPEGDLPMDVVGAESGAMGELVSVDEEERAWRVRPLSGSFAPGEAVHAAYGGEGVVDTLGPWRGPYTAPAGCRKVWGVTRRPPGSFSHPARARRPDYGEPLGATAQFEAGPVNALDNTFTFARDPSLDIGYWWVFWRAAPDITGFSDRSQLVIPASHHLQFARLCAAGADALLSGGRFDDQLVQQFLGGWRASLRAAPREEEAREPQRGDGLI